MKEHQSALQFTDIWQKSQFFAQPHKILWSQIFSWSASAWTSVFSAMLVCSHWTSGLSSFLKIPQATRTAWTVSAFLLYPVASELWLLSTFSQHIDALPWFFLPNFSARLVNDLRLPDSQISFLIHSYFSLSRPVLRSLGRHFPAYMCCPPVFLAKLCKPNTFVLNCIWFWKLSLSWTKQGMLSGKILMGEEGIRAFVLEVWVWQHSACWNCSSKEGPTQPQAGAVLLDWETWGNGWNCLSSLLAETAKNLIRLYWQFLNWSFLLCLRTYTLPKFR